LTPRVAPGGSNDWRYPDEGRLAHLLVAASGPGGTTEQTPFGLYHEN